MDWLSSLFQDARLVELRHLDGRRVTSGLFDSELALREAAASLAGRGSLYTTLHRPQDRLVATNAMTARALADDDIAEHVRLVFDFDPVRGTGTNSTDAELQAAQLRAREFAAALTRFRGWPMPALGMSGNGAHVVFRCRFPAMMESRAMLTTFYRGLAAKWSTELVTFDATVRNPSRIWRLYGSVNRKGPHTSDRPQRLAAIRVPERWEAVSLSQIATISEELARKAQTEAKPIRKAAQGPDHPLGSGDYTTLDAVSWFQAHGAYLRQIDPHKHGVRCPWSDEHTSASNGSDTVIFVNASGWPGFHCSHSHCDGRGITDVMRLWGDADRFCEAAWRRA